MNHVVQEILAEALELVSDDDPRLELVTITGVDTDTGLEHATVYYSARAEGADDALKEHRVALQAAIGRQTRLKRTPVLTFVPDPAITTGWRIEGILHDLGEADHAD